MLNGGHVVKIYCTKQKSRNTQGNAAQVKNNNDQNKNFLYGFLVSFIPGHKLINPVEIEKI